MVSNNSDFRLAVRYNNKNRKSRSKAGKIHNPVGDENLQHLSQLKFMDNIGAGRLKRYLFYTEFLIVVFRRF